MDDRTLLVVGLGNPGPQYAGTRHNVGQMALDVLADRMRATFRSHRSNAQVAQGRAVPGGPKLILAKPSSFMNLSGGRSRTSSSTSRSSPRSSSSRTTSSTSRSTR